MKNNLHFHKCNSNSLNGINCWNFHVGEKLNVSPQIKAAIDLRAYYIEKRRLYNDYIYYNERNNEQSNQTPQEAEYITVRNLRNAASQHPVTNGWFGEPQKCKSSSRHTTRQIFTADPISEANDFYRVLASGGTEEPISTNKKMKNGAKVSVETGVRTILPDKSVITKRLETSSPGSPAVGLKLKKNYEGIRANQKIHFVRRAPPSNKK